MSDLKSKKKKQQQHLNFWRTLSVSLSFKLVCMSCCLICLLSKWVNVKQQQLANVPQCFYIVKSRHYLLWIYVSVCPTDSWKEFTEQTSITAFFSFSHIPWDVKCLFSIRQFKFFSFSFWASNCLCLLTPLGVLLSPNETIPNKSGFLVLWRRNQNQVSK